MTQNLKNILLVSGSGRNVGKTTFICRVIEKNTAQKPVALKITPHFHEPTSGLKPVAIHENFRIFQETDSLSGKDSSLFLKAGAEMVYYIQTTDAFLREAFELVSRQLPPNRPVVAESAALRKYFVPGLYLFIQKKNQEIKTSAWEMQKQAHETIFSDGEDFSLSPKSITFNQSWKIENI